MILALSAPTPAPAPSYDLVGPLMQGILSTPGVWWNAFLTNPGPWLIVGAIFALVAALKVVEVRFSRSRRSTRR